MRSKPESKNLKLTIVCAFCGKYMGEKNGNGVEGISHGVCYDCFREWQIKVNSRAKSK